MADLSKPLGWDSRTWAANRTWGDAVPIQAPETEGNSMTSITLTLTRPIANGPELVSTLILRQPRLGDSPLLMNAYAAFATGDVGSLADNLLDVLSSTSGLPRSVVDQIDPADLDAVLAGLTQFIGEYTKR